MMGALKQHWNALSARERKLMAVAGILAAGLLLWLLLRPIMAISRDLVQDHQTAIEREGRVAAKIAALKPPAQAGSAADLSSPAQYLAQSASEIGLSLSRNEARGAGVSIAIASGKAQTMLAWIAELESQGFIMDALSLTPLADGTLGLTADVRVADAQAAQR